MIVTYSATRVITEPQRRLAVIGDECLLTEMVIAMWRELKQQPYPLNGEVKIHISAEAKS